MQASNPGNREGKHDRGNRGTVRYITENAPDSFLFSLLLISALALSTIVRMVGADARASTAITVAQVEEKPGNQNDRYNLRLTIACPEKAFKQGDEIPITFTVTNMGKSTYSYIDRNNDRSGRLGEYELVAIISGPIEISVEPRSRRQIGMYLEKLSKELKAGKKPYRARRGTIIRQMVYTCDKRIVPVLIGLMYEKSDSFWVREAFLYYLPHDLDILNAILEVMKKRGLAYGMQQALEQLGCTEEDFEELILRSLKSDNAYTLIAGALAAQEHPHDSSTPMLTAIATDINSPARWQAIYALANNQNDQSSKTLKLLLEDSDQEIRKLTKRAMRSAARSKLRAFPQ